MSLEVQIGRNDNNICAIFEKAVARIERINSDNNSVNVEVGYYADNTARTIVKNGQTTNNRPMENSHFIKRSNHRIQMSEIDELDFDKTDMTVTDILKTACYKKLKELSQFENAIDI